MCRPTKYKKSYCDAIIEYFKAGTIKNFPTLPGFCATIGVCEDTLYEWAKVHSEFSDAMSKSRVFGKDLLIKGSMTSSFNGNFAKFVAINCYGMSEKTETKNETTLNIPTGININFIKSKEA